MTVGVYLLRKGTEVVYVGQSINIENRLRNHRAIRRDFDSFEIIETPIDDLLRVEQKYILKYRPVQNGVTTRWGRSFLDRDGVDGKTPAQRQKAFYTRRKRGDLVLVRAWLPPREAEKAKRLIRWMEYKTAKDAAYVPYMKEG